jgi:hypothetical protein
MKIGWVCFSIGRGRCGTQCVGGIARHRRPVRALVAQQESFRHRRPGAHLRRRPRTRLSLARLRHLLPTSRSVRQQPAARHDCAGRWLLSAADLSAPMVFFGLQAFAVAVQDQIKDYLGTLAMLHSQVRFFTLLSSSTFPCRFTVNVSFFCLSTSAHQLQYAIFQCGSKTPPSLLGVEILTRPWFNRLRCLCDLIDTSRDLRGLQLLSCVHQQWKLAAGDDVVHGCMTAVFNAVCVVFHRLLVAWLAEGLIDNQAEVLKL